MTSEGGSKLTVDDASSYLKAVKDVFKDKMENYSYFLDLMKDYKDKRIDIEGVAAKVKEMFKGHNHLLLGFNTFLPSRIQITVEQEEGEPSNRIPDGNQMEIDSLEDKQPFNEQPPQTMPEGDQVIVPSGNEPPPPMRRPGGYAEATYFLSKVKARFQGNVHVYKSFLNMMNMLGEGKKSMTETYQEVVALLEGHADLQEELIQFFPGTSRAASI